MSFLSELFARLDALDAEAKDLGIETLPAVAGWLSANQPIVEQDTDEEDEDDGPRADEYYDEV